MSINWGHILGKDDFVWELNIDDKTEISRYVSEMSRDYLIKLFDLIEAEGIDVNESIYINSKTGKPLNTSSLNRELKRFSEMFLKMLKEKHEWNLNLKPLKSNAFQIAWALKMLYRYHYSKKAFIAVSKFMGHKSLKYTTDLLEIEPIEDIIFNFHTGNYSQGIRMDALEHPKEVARIVLTTIEDEYAGFKSSMRGDY
ncbi:hypothetical protein [Winogradskyella sp.]